MERLGALLQEKEKLVAQWRQEAHAAQEAADAASRAARQSEEFSIQACTQPHLLTAKQHDIPSLAFPLEKSSSLPLAEAAWRAQ